MMLVINQLIGKGKFMDKEKSVEDKKRHPEATVLPVIRLAFGTIYLVPIVYIIVFFGNPFGGPGDWADFATYFSGMAMPVIAFCSALLFFRSIIVQRNEFDKTRREMQQATKLQIASENERQKLKKQEQLERAIPIVRDLHKKLFSNMTRWNKKGLPKDDETTVHNPRAFLRWYSEKSIHLITMLNSYLNAGGDIYLLFDWLNALESEWEEVDEFAKKHSLDEEYEYKTYLKSLNQISERRDLEVKNYAKKWG